MNNTVVEQLRSIVEDSRVFEQLVGAGIAEQVGWVCVYAVLLAVTLPSVRLGLRKARAVEDPEIKKLLLVLAWLGGGITLALVAYFLVASSVTLYQYHEFPKAMVLRDVLNRI